MAAEIDLDTKPTLDAWLAENVWLKTLLKETLQAYRDGYQTAHDEAARRFGLDSGKSGPQVRGA